MRSIKGIPQLIQAIQYSLESNYPTTTIHTSHSDSAIESALTQNLYTTEHSQNNSWIECEEWTNAQSRVDVKRQSIFVVFPYSETLPVDPNKLKMRRTSSEHDLSRLKEEGFHNKFKDNVKKEQIRRPSIEVRYVGLQGIWMAKLSSKQQHSWNKTLMCFDFTESVILRFVFLNDKKKLQQNARTYKKTKTAETR